MPCIPTPTALSNSVLPADPFSAAVVQGVRRAEARVRRKECLTGIPHRFSYCLRQTAELTGLCSDASQADPRWRDHRQQDQRLVDDRTRTVSEASTDQHSGPAIAVSRQGNPSIPRRGIDLAA